MLVQTPAAAPRLNFLDGLRGLAALGVVAHHFTAAFYPTSMTGNPATAHLPGGWEANFAASPLHVLLNFRVCFFFVLSGLVLAESAGRMRRGLRPLLAQLARRYVRLGGPLAVGVVLAWGLLQAGAFRNQPAAAASGAAWFGQFWHAAPSLGQVLLDAPGAMLRGVSHYNPVLWTMPVEWLGSVLVLGLLALVGGWRGRLWLYAALALGIILARPIYHVALALGLTLARPNFYYVAFVLGLGLHDVYRRAWVAALPATPRRLLALALLVLAVVAAGHPQIYHRADSAAYAWMRLPGVSPDRTVQFYHTIGAVALLAAVLLSGRLRRLADVGLLRRVGKRAFALYLTHFLWLGSGASGLFLALRAGEFSYHASFGLMALTSVPVLIISTEAFYCWVDVPSHRLARRVSGWVLSTKLAAAASRS